MSTEQPTTNWRLLLNGEIVAKGDEVSSTDGHRWCPCMGTVGSRVRLEEGFIYRRPIVVEGDY